MTPVRFVGSGVAAVAVGLLLLKRGVPSWLEPLPDLALVGMIVCGIALVAFGLRDRLGI